ncbi:MAG: MFS transporter, partial [Spirochaeta sp.]
NSVFLIVMLLYVQQITGSPLRVAMVQIAAFLPVALLAVFSGRVADRFSKRTILVLSDVLRGCAMLILALLLLLYPGNSYYMLIAASLAVGIGSAFFAPAVQAFLPHIVNDIHLDTANALRAGSLLITAVIGNLLGGILYAAVGTGVVLALNGISFLLSAFSEYRILEPGHGSVHTGLGNLQAGPAPAGFEHPGCAQVVVGQAVAGQAVPGQAVAGQADEVHIPAAEGLSRASNRRASSRNANSRNANSRNANSRNANSRRAGRLTPQERAMVIMHVCFTATYPAMVVAMPFYLSRVLGRSEVWLGVLVSLAFCGSLFGFAAMRRSRVSAVIRLRIAFASVAAALIGLAVTPSLTGAAAGLAAACLYLPVFGAAGAVIYLHVVGRVQSDSRQPGRVFGIIEAWAAIATPIGYAVGGVALEFGSVQPVLALLSLPSLCILLWVPRLFHGAKNGEVRV